jgi:deazaflavin-dependent oxidoreductase (nitroreductase family)
MSEWNEKVIAEFRAGGGMVGGAFEGASLLLLTTVGAVTGKRRTTPLVYRRGGGRLLVFASNLGAPAHPAWYHNLLANPQVSVEIGDGETIETYPATAHPLRGPERDRHYAEQAALDPAFAEYQARISRVIPVIALYRRDPAPVKALGDELVRIHDGLRRELATLLTDTEAGRAVELREHCLAFCEAIHAHHTTETNAGFPRIAERFPDLVPVLDRLRLEHDRLARIRQDLRAALESGDRVHAELRRLSAELEAHFDREEAQLVEALNAL